MKRHGQVDSEHNLWLRCWNCEEEASRKDPRKKVHLSVQLRTGIYHCYRCNTSGQLSTQELLQLYTTQDIIEDFNTENSPKSENFLDYDYEDALQAGTPITRFSHLPRYHYISEDGIWDAFLRWLPGIPEPMGLHLRKDKRSNSYGEGFGWVDPPTLYSTPEDPLRIVEGPYDVVNTRDLAVFGLPSPSKLKVFGTGHSIILCPDGDVWLKPALCRSVIKTVEWLLTTTGWACPYLVSLEFLPEGLDPDEVPVSQRTSIPRNELPQFLRQLKQKGL